MEVKLETENLEISEPIYYQKEKTPIGLLSELALTNGKWEFSSSHLHSNVYELTHKTGLQFSAELTEGKEHKQGTYKIISSIKKTTQSSSVNTVNISGEGRSGKKLRKAQLGSIHALLAHWSLNNNAATIVLPTGTGKTETMLTVTLIDNATRVLVVVPSIELKNQIADKFLSWGMLRELGVIDDNYPNPKVLVLNKTIPGVDSIKYLEMSDVVITTPALIARASDEVKAKISNIFSHLYFDEAHHVAANEWASLKKLFKKLKIVQFTATPYRNDRQPIEGKIVYNYPLSKALEENCFSRISLISVDEIHPRKKDKSIAVAAMDRLYKDRKAGFKNHCMMVRASGKSQAEYLYSKYKKWYPGERIIMIHSGTPGKKEIIKSIKNNNYDIVICVEMLKEGFDHPEFKIAAVHGMHKSLSVLLQFIGRFTRTRSDLGDASFVINFADEKMSNELENLFQEGAGWENVISEIADARKQQAESLLEFLQDCQPLAGFDSPDINLNPKVVYPPLSCISFKCKNVDWFKFNDAFNLQKYALSQPYINSKKGVFYFTTQKREKVKWVKSKQMKNQTWDLIVMHHDPLNKMLYVGFTEKKLPIDEIVESISVDDAKRFEGDCVFNAFDSIKRLSIVHAGIFKPANHLHRYSRLSGADVTTELTRWKSEGRCQKSDFVGIGFRDGFPVSIGASVKGKIWSPARVGNIKEWTEWSKNIGRLITDKNINSNQLLEDSAKKIEIKNYPDNMVVLAADWADNIFRNIYKITIEDKGKDPTLLSEASIKFLSFKGNESKFNFITYEITIPFTIELGGEKGHKVIGLDDSEIIVEGLKSKPLTLKEFFQENPPTMFLINGCTISGCIHTDYGECDIQIIPDDCIEPLIWSGVDYTIESLYKSSESRENSIQEYMMQHLLQKGATIVFNDDNAGESADIVAIFLSDEEVKFEMVHCKYSKAVKGARKTDLYEVCGQAIVSLRYKWKPEELLKHMQRRNGAGVLKNRRFYHGQVSDLDRVKNCLKYCDVKFRFAIAQPGVSKSSLNNDMKRVLGSVYSTVVEMTETKLHCYINT